MFNLERPASLTMLGHQFAYSAAPICGVNDVHFGILSPEDIVRVTFFVSSVTHIHPFQRSWMSKMDGLMRPCIAAADEPSPLVLNPSR